MKVEGQREGGEEGLGADPGEEEEEELLLKEGGAGGAGAAAASPGHRSPARCRTTSHRRDRGQTSAPP